MSEDYLIEWKAQQEFAEKTIPIVGNLYRDKGVAVQIYGRRIMNVNTIDVIKAHRYARQLVGNELKVEDTYALLDEIRKMPLHGPARIDVGRLATAYAERSETGESIQAFLERELAKIAGDQAPGATGGRDVVLYGFGRIGRLLARLMIERTGSGNKMRLRAIVVRGGRDGDLEKRASLLRRDSVHGPFNGTITTDHENNAIIANGNFVRVIYANSPAEIDYTAYGINNALVVDNTGIWSDEEGLGQHLKSKGVARVLLTAPAKGKTIKNIVYGINHEDLNADEKIACAASCTTNAIVPVLKVIDDEYGIDNGHLETVHSYTNDQNLIDNYHKADRRGRSAPLNMVITSTGAAKAVAKVLPQLSGKLTGNAIRVPTPNVSLAVMNLYLKRETTKEELNSMLSQLATNSPLQDQVGFTTSTELVSSDLVGDTHAGVVDAAASIVEGRRCVLYVWYDNEAGYSNQVYRLMQKMVGLQFINLPARVV